MISPNHMYNANSEELSILEFWKKNNTFEKSVQNRPEDKPYVFYDGPPFATGLPHYGHILASVIKDVVPRYWTMKGYRVPRKWIWDCHGLPIESLIEKELKISSKKQIEDEFGVDKFNEVCKSKVLLYVGEWKKMVERVGRWVEYDNSAKTMDPTYMESVWWSLKTIWDKGLIYEGRKVLMYCPHCETPVSKAEIAMDNSYKTITEESVTVKFQITNSKSQINSPAASGIPLWRDKLQIPNNVPVYLLAWTTTPWTLPGNVALAVGNDVEYVLVSFVISSEARADEKSLSSQAIYYIVARDRMAEVFKGKDYSIINELKGSELVGLEYEPLFDMPAMLETGKKAYYVSEADFVTTEDGTGIVHTAVIYGEDDYNLGLKLDLPMVPMLNEKAEFNEVAPEFIQGKYFKKAEKEIKNDLDKRGLLFSREQYTHSYPHCWRCDTMLIYNAISAWFINIQKIKPRLIELNEKINWYPEHLKEGRFLNILETAPDWNISRNRYWATPLPFWKCVGSQASATTPRPSLVRRGGTVSPPARGGVAAQAAGVVGGCDHVVCVGSVQELKEKAANFSEVFPTDNVAELDLHKQFMDKIKLKCDECGGVMDRIPEVIDCWVESGSVPFGPLHYPFENKEEFKSRFPGQYIAEYINQTRAWFYYMHVMAALLFDDVSFENCVTTGEVQNEKGEKLSKSKQNFTDPWIIIEQYGVDAIRYYLMTSPVMLADNLLFNEREVKELFNKVINILWNVVEFYKMYAVTPTVIPSEARADEGSLAHPTIDRDSSPLRRGFGMTKRSSHILDKWIMAKLHELVKTVTVEMDQYNTVKAGRPIKDFIDELSTWYVRRSRDRFKGESQEDKEFALHTLHQVLLTLSKLMAPFTPFIAEKIYQSISGTGYGIRDTGSGVRESVHLEDWPQYHEAHHDKSVLEEMEVARKIVELGLALRAEAKQKVRQPLSQLTINNEHLSHELLQIIADELNVKKVEFAEYVEEGADWVSKEEGKVKVWLNIKIDEQLKKEGLLREVIRAINQMRKEQKLTINDQVVVSYATSDADLLTVFEKYNDELKRSVLATALKPGAADGQEVTIENKAIKISISR
ncbi:MAG: isoleucine--tRNA ligase [Candidatus Magasanikbacteria bacterium]|nr:isoleucine--tRNA ligase [Candidatus Magasanikbacteria bacterium]